MSCVRPQLLELKNLEGSVRNAQKFIVFPAVIATMLTIICITLIAPVSASFAEASVTEYPITNKPPKFGGPVTTQETATIKIGSGVTRLTSAGVTVTLTATIPSGVKLGAFTINIQYDGAVVNTSTANCAADPSHVMSFSFCNVLPNNVVALTGISAVGAGGEIVLATITFDGVSLGNSILAVTVSSFTDPTGTAIPFASTNGTVTVASPVIINELMINPSAVTDANGEWFELYNATGSTIDINGCVLSNGDGSDNHTIAGSLPIPPDGYLVLGRNTDVGANGGVSVAYDYV
ncbi:MAG: lamin tail domain-containing protein [Chloroflexi bacterium]|nr:MAG: lamin tail domain-containing protein [Chloroflexota bacterium]